MALGNKACFDDFDQRLDLCKDPEDVRNLYASVTHKFWFKLVVGVGVTIFMVKVIIITILCRRRFLKRYMQHPSTGFGVMVIPGTGKLDIKLESTPLLNVFPVISKTLLSYAIYQTVP